MSIHSVCNILNSINILDKCTVPYTKINFTASTTFWESCNPLVYQILAGMRSFFEKLKPDIKNVIISDRIFDGKMQFLDFWSKRPFVPGRGIQSPNVQIASLQAPIVQAYRLRKDSSFSSMAIKKVLKFLNKTQRLNWVYKFHRFLSMPVSKIRFLAPLIKNYHIRLVFIHVLLQAKTKHLPSSICFPCP